MLELDLKEKSVWSDEKEEFVKIPSVHLKLEHSLISVKKWESKWHKPFLAKNEKTYPEIIDYIKCMTIGTLPPDEVYQHLSEEDVKKITDYIQDPRTATVIRNYLPEGKGKSINQEVVTNELIYYYMITLGIPVEFQKWHLEELMTLIKVIKAKNEPKKKMSVREQMSQQRALNEARKAKYHTSG